MYRVDFQNSRGLNLVGDFYSAESESVIIMAHGFTGDRAEWGRLTKAAQAFNDAGYNVLNFDFSGCGESDDDSLTVDKQVDDLENAIKFVDDSMGLKRIGLFGLSLGGLVTAKACGAYNDERIKTMVWWAPVTAAKKNYGQKKFSAEQLEELEEKGYITKYRDKGVRKKIMIDRQMIADREGVDQELLLSKIRCPVLILHGDKDDMVPLQDSKNAMQYLPPGSRLEIIPGADHGFYEQLDRFIELSIGWFDKNLER